MVFYIVLDPESAEKIEKCSHYFNCSTREVLKLAIDELWNRRIEVYKRRQSTIERTININQLELFS